MPTEASYRNLRLVNIAMPSFLCWYQKTCNINLTRSLLAHLFLSVRKLTSSYTAVQACAVYAAVALIIFAALEVFLDVPSVPPNSSWSGTARHLTCDLLLLSDAAVQTDSIV